MRPVTSQARRPIPAQALSVWELHADAACPWPNLAHGTWINALLARRPASVVKTAIANKLARVAWAVLQTGKDTELRRLQLPKQFWGRRRRLQDW